tara:strand:- start:1300 stop:1716 length:417 start_codon:yes stop_codon:yes gene_type:complete
MATVGIINGTKFGVYDGGTLVAYATSGSLSINHNARETSNKESGGYKEILEGQRDWEISCEGMVAFDGGATKSIDELFTSYIATRASLTVSFESSESGDKKWSGTAFLTSISLDAPNEESTTYSCSFAGTGALTMASS